MSAIFSLIGRTAGTGAKAAQGATKAAQLRTTALYQAFMRSTQAVKAGATVPPKITKAAAAAKTAAKAATTSKTAQTAAKVGILGGAVGVGGLLAGTGIEAAVVKPFKQLGLVTTDQDGRPTGMTKTGKVVAIGLLTIAALGIVAYMGGRLAK